MCGDDAVLINEVVHFFPASNMLRSVRSGGPEIILNAPVGRCLGLLLESPGKTVLRQYFYDEVWLKHGLYVTDNTFYQNISILRKALKTVGINDDVIKTVPRKGLCFTGAVAAVASRPAQAYLTSKNEETENKNNSSWYVLCIMYFINKLKNRSLIVALSSLIILTSIVLIFSSVLRQMHVALTNYQPMMVRSCMVYFSGVKNKNEAESTILNHGFDCKKNETIFLSVNEKSLRTSIFICEGYLSANQHCQSWLFIKEKQ